MGQEQFGDMWDAATRDLDAEADARAYTQARIETVNLWPFLARAETREDYENRKALLIPKVAGKIENPQLRDRVLAAWDEDYAIIHPTAGVTCPACGSPRQERHHLNTEGRQGYTCKHCQLSWDMPKTASPQCAWAQERSGGSTADCGGSIGKLSEHADKDSKSYCDVHADARMSELDKSASKTADEDHRYVTTNDGAVLDVHHSRLGGMFVATCERCGITIATWDDEEELKSHVCDPEDIAKRNEIYGSKTAGEGDDSTKPAMDGTGVEKEVQPNAGGSVGQPTDSETPPLDDTLTEEASLEVLLGVAEGENPTDWLDKDAWPPLVPVESEPKDESVPEVGGSQEGGFAQIGEPAGAKFSVSLVSSKTGVSLTNVGLDGDNGVGTDPSGKRVKFKLSPEDRKKLSDVLFSDLAVNFSGVDVEEGDIISEASKTAANDPDYHKIMQDNRNDPANKPSKRPPSMPTPTDTRCGKCGYLVHPGSSAGPCPSCGSPVSRAAARKTAEETWDTGEVELWFANDEGLYFGSAGMTDPDEFREMWEGSTPNETVNADNVDWNAVAQSRHEGSRTATDGDGDEDAEGQKKYPEVSTDAPENEFKPKDAKTASDEASLVCNECGRKFSHKLAADTFEIECPGCGGFDTDLHFEAGGNPFTPENNPMGSGGAGDTSGGMNDNPMDQGMDTETPGAPAEVKTPVTTRPRGGDTDMTQPAGGAQPGGGVTQGFASRSAT